MIVHTSYLCNKKFGWEVGSEPLEKEFGWSMTWVPGKQPLNSWNFLSKECLCYSWWALIVYPNEVTQGLTLESLSS